MNRTQAKTIVSEALKTFAGFDCVMPTAELNRLAGYVQHLNWTESQLQAEFKNIFSTPHVH